MDIMKLKRILALVLSFVLAVPFTHAVSLTADDMVAPIFFGENLDTQGEVTETYQETTPESLESGVQVYGTPAAVFFAGDAPVGQTYGIAPLDLSTTPEPETIVLEGNQDSGVSATDGNNYIVNGDVFYGDEKGASVNCTDGSSVIVNGDVIRDSASSMGVFVNDGYVHVTGDVDATYGDSGKKYADGVELDRDNSMAVVDGNIIAPDRAIDCAYDNTVIVGGNVTSTDGTGVVATSKSNIDIGGVVKAAGNEFDIDVIYNDDQPGVIKVGGIEGGTEASLHFTVRDRACFDNLEEYMPDIVIGEVKNNADNFISVDTINEDRESCTLDSGKEVEEIYDMIQYVITVDYDKTLGTHKISGTNYNSKYGSATEDSELVVTIVPNEECTLKEVKTDNDKLNLKRIGDGVYTITVPRGGGVKINAVLEKIVKVETNTKPTTPTDPEGSDKPGNPTPSKPSNNTSTNAIGLVGEQKYSDSVKIEPLSYNSNINFNNNNSNNSNSISSVETLDINAETKDIINASNEIIAKVGMFTSTSDYLVLDLYDKTIFDANDLVNITKISRGKKILVYYWWNNIEYVVEIPANYPLYELVGVDGKVSRLKLSSTFGSKRTGRTR